MTGGCVCGAPVDPGICDGRGCPLGGHSHCNCAHAAEPPGETDELHADELRRALDGDGGR